MTANDIAKASACYNCSDQGFMLAQIIYLLNQIVASGGTGGGGSSGLIGASDPNGEVSAAPGTTYFSRRDSTFWVQNNTVTSSTGWLQLI